MKENLKAWALDPTGWSLEGGEETFDISQLEDTPENHKKLFYKQQWIEGWDKEREIAFNQNLIVTYSLKYKQYQQTIRNRQVERAIKAMQNPSTLERHTQTDSFSVSSSLSSAYSFDHS